VQTVISGTGNNDPSGCEVQVELESRELWSKFAAHSTEMVITKSGRSGIIYVAYMAENNNIMSSIA